MKKTLTIFVLFAMLFNTAGYYIVYEFGRYLIKKEVTSLLEHGYLDHQLSVFSIYNPPANPAFRRVDKHEIVYQGNLYDVAREVKKGKTITFYCIRDTREENLIAGMNSMQQKKKATNLLQHLVSIALPVTMELAHPPSTTRITYPLVSENFDGNPLIPFSPPPEIA
ncbi:MAG: hypothetical protein NTW31_11410 [Bacteroidetes bacterium]|nr:hypothetical protein [Bacteroidota bacterium]